MDEKTKFKIVAAGVGVLVILASLYVFRVPDSDRGTVPEVNVHQSETGRNIRDAQQRVDSIGTNIDRATESAGRMSERIDNAQKRTSQLKESNGRIKDLVAESERLAKESRGILESLPEVDGK